MESLTELFCDVDDFCQAFMPIWNHQLLESGQKRRRRARSLQNSGISFIDSTSLDVCLNQRIHCHKVFAGLAARGHTSMGWFFGFKPHLMLLSNRLLLLRRAIIETISDQLKNISQIEHSRHRSVLIFLSMCCVV